MLFQLSLRVFGHVQGVNFRRETRDLAQSLGLTGWVRNTPDGSVEVLAEGEKAVLEQLLGWCREGPEYARVERVEEIWKEIHYKSFEKFEIR